ncbi:hypothetical protein IM538_02135 [Cytobacillus suaedae]|uniref:Uncharacterized protein n=1 Tax=Litchfieldia luteola TaxID=682179 RepID=A0ABR9QQ33_9BACI|nr:hypothetical protein [Cytobacillus luteolus]MBE4910618.1 hypothetical protein [Cytobacillus luteolus]MBP1943798.1 hypothetical protein [Cytobacillus luteolus]QOR66996.1 hypothetical protein IM538_02135 [Cytobacillus suaedae]
MTNSSNNEQEVVTETKKLSLQELAKQRLASKKQEQNAGKTGGNAGLQGQKMKSQMTKKPSNTRRKMGS